MSETPTISSSNYTNTTYTPGMWDTSTTIAGTVTSAPSVGFVGMGVVAPLTPYRAEVWDNARFEQLEKKINPFQQELAAAKPAAPAAAAAPKPVQKEKEVATRIVKVYIADTNDNLKVSDQLLHRGQEHLTDATDQELFFEIPINEILKTHNELRAGTRDRKASEKAGKDIFLEPIRIRDLKMVVVTVASF